MRRLLTFLLAAVFAGTAFAANDNLLGLQKPLDLNPATAAAPSKPSNDATPAPVSPPAPAPEIRPEPPQPGDYAINLKSDAFGSQLFTGAFARQGAAQFNPDYLIAIGDRIQLRLWGGYSFDNTLTVDPQGNLFIPYAGPVKVQGVRNHDLQATIEKAVRRAFQASVFSYASLAAAQPVRVFVGGFVNRPGLYNGTSMDSLLHYLDQAGGIDPARGSFLDVKVKRGEQVRVQVNLYDFLLEGRIPLVQLADGDVIFVAPRQNTVKVNGLAENTRRFEFAGSGFKVSDLIKLAKPSAQATHVRVVRNTGSVRNVEYYPLAQAEQVVLTNGDELEFTADKKPGTITVRVEGEHQSAQEYVLPYGARLGELIERIELTENSDAASVQLFRLSVRERQRLMLETSLKSLESTALTARSGTSDEARLRKEESELILRWVERARKIEPAGQVLIAQASERDQLLLENGDILRIPKRDGLVLISGEVLFPNAVAFDTGLVLDDYVRRAGGYTQNADVSRVVVAHRDGSFDEAVMDNRDRLVAAVRPGDEILVLPRIDVKSRQVFKDLTQILFQIAISAKVVLGL